MKSTRKIRNSIEEYKFEDDKALIQGLIVGNIMLALIFLVGDLNLIISDLRTQLCMISGLFFLIIHKYYEWKSPKVNVVFMLIYLLIFMIEFLYIGIPESAIRFDENRLSKGAMLEMFIGFLPYLYIGIRLALIFPLIQIIFSSKKLKNNYQII